MRPNVASMYAPSDFQIPTVSDVYGRSSSPAGLCGNRVSYVPIRYGFRPIGNTDPFAAAQLSGVGVSGPGLGDFLTDTTNIGGMDMNTALLSAGAVILAMAWIGSVLNIGRGVGEYRRARARKRERREDIKRQIAELKRQL